MRDSRCSRLMVGTDGCSTGPPDGRRDGSCGAALIETVGANARLPPFHLPLPLHQLNRITTTAKEWPYYGHRRRQGYSGSTCTPRAERKFRCDLQGKFVSAPQSPMDCSKRSLCMVLAAWIQNLFLKIERWNMCILVKFNAVGSLVVSCDVTTRTVNQLLCWELSPQVPKWSSTSSVSLSVTKGVKVWRNLANSGEFAALAPLPPVHVLSPDQLQQSGIHCLIICGIHLLTPNNLGGTWRRICSPDIRSDDELEVLRNSALQIDIYLLTYLLTGPLFCNFWLRSRTSIEWERHNFFTGIAQYFGWPGRESGGFELPNYRVTLSQDVEYSGTSGVHQR